jgi:PAS domain S-box-containing protein
MNMNQKGEGLPLDAVGEADLVPPQGTKDLLIVDDDVSLRNGLELLLGSPDRSIQSCGSVAEAIEILQTRSFDLVLLDYGLPDGTGLNLMDWLIAQQRGEAVVIEAAIGALRRGVGDFLRKPYHVEELRRTVASALHKRDLERFNRQMADRLRESEKLHRYLVDSSPDLVYMLDANGCFTYLNSRIESLLGYSREATTGSHFSTLLHEDDQPKARHAFGERRTGDRASSNVELRIKLGPGREAAADRNPYLTVVLSSTGIYKDGLDGQSSRYIGTYGVARDISERKRAELQISALNRSLESRVADRTSELERANKDLEAFAYSVSHDLRTPLRSIHGFATLLEQGMDRPLTEECRDYLNRLRRNVERMDILIDNMLDFSRAGRRHLHGTRVDLGTLVQSLVAERRDEFPRARFEIGTLPAVAGDQAMLIQVFENLLNNALKFSSRREQQTVEVFARPAAGERVEVVVRDNGVGFDMNAAAHLFGVFQRLHREADFPGTGIGLAIVKRIVERHGGNVSASAEPGKGASFCLCLPLAPRP